MYTKGQAWQGDAYSVCLLSWCLRFGCGSQTLTHSALTVEYKAVRGRPRAAASQRKITISWGVGGLPQGRGLKQDFIVLF